MQDPRTLNIEVLNKTVYMLLALQDSQEAREITYESNVILPILGYLANDQKDIRALWYEAIKELCAF
jgi:hypothetical protein